MARLWHLLLLLAGSGFLRLVFEVWVYLHNAGWHLAWFLHVSGLGWYVVVF